MEASTAKRGVYPLHGYKLGLYRLPVRIDEPGEIKSIVDGLKKTFKMDTYADRIYATHSWTEHKEGPDSESADLSVTVEIVTGEVVDIIYQVFPLEKFGDPVWVTDYRKKADHYAKMIIDTILRNTIMADKMIESVSKSKKITKIDAMLHLEEMTPLAKIVPNAKPKPIAPAPAIEGQPAPAAEIPVEVPDGAKPGPIDIEYKSHMPSSDVYKVEDHTIKTWGRKGKDNAIMGVWGEFVSVDFDICVADGACIDACPVNVYEWFDTPGNAASEKKPLMSKEPDCIFCLACEEVCPPKAIKIFEAS